MQLAELAAIDVVTRNVEHTAGVEGEGRTGAQLLIEVRGDVGAQRDPAGIVVCRQFGQRAQISGQEDGVPLGGVLDGADNPGRIKAAAVVPLAEGLDGAGFAGATKKQKAQPENRGQRTTGTHVR